MLQIDIEDHVTLYTTEREWEIGERTTGLITPNMTQGLKRSETYDRVVCP